MAAPERQLVDFQVLLHWDEAWRREDPAKRLRDLRDIRSPSDRLHRLETLAYWQLLQRAACNKQEMTIEEVIQEEILCHMKGEKEGCFGNFQCAQSCNIRSYLGWPEGIPLHVPASFKRQGELLKDIRMKFIQAVFNQEVQAGRMGAPLGSTMCSLQRVVRGGKDLLIKAVAPPVQRSSAASQVSGLTERRGLQSHPPQTEELNGIVQDGACPIQEMQSILAAKEVKNRKRKGDSSRESNCKRERTSGPVEGSLHCSLDGSCVQNPGVSSVPQPAPPSMTGAECAIMPPRPPSNPHPKAKVRRTVETAVRNALDRQVHDHPKDVILRHFYSLGDPLANSELWTDLQSWDNDGVIPPNDTRRPERQIVDLLWDCKEKRDKLYTTTEELEHYKAVDRFTDAKARVHDIALGVLDAFRPLLDLVLPDAALAQLVGDGDFEELDELGDVFGWGGLSSEQGTVSSFLGGLDSDSSPQTESIQGFSATFSSSSSVTGALLDSADSGSVSEESFVLDSEQQGACRSDEDILAHLSVASGEGLGDNFSVEPSQAPTPVPVPEVDPTFESAKTESTDMDFECSDESLEEATGLDGTAFPSDTGAERPASSGGARDHVHTRPSLDRGLPEVNRKLADTGKTDVSSGRPASEKPASPKDTAPSRTTVVTWMYWILFLSFFAMAGAPSYCRVPRSDLLIYDGNVIRLDGDSLVENISDVVHQECHPIVTIVSIMKDCMQQLEKLLVILENRLEAERNSTSRARLDSQAPEDDGCLVLRWADLVIDDPLASGRGVEATINGVATTLQTLTLAELYVVVDFDDTTSYAYEGVWDSPTIRLKRDRMVAGRNGLSIGGLAVGGDRGSDGELMRLFESWRECIRQEGREGPPTVPRYFTLTRRSVVANNQACP
eukprot:TRINITY_DN11304_c0_g1_i1.p1 TRINITY_DN11304_c0_g1~~TRINITY_DN11304_c0_g1_i1.p1  ORF type:complete len:896 (-),score=111.99 TRINITY_DN11304_c0_g1_i1:381-3068(-)